MKIAFLCGSLEPWRDGVGDYTRHLAADLKAAGHEVLLVALADPFVDSLVDVQSEVSGVAILRLPKTLWQSRQLQAVQAALNDFAADWVSLQMVIYSYDDRGLLHDLGQQLIRLGGPAHRHVMLHELWIGAGERSSIKDRVTGWMQKQLLLRALRQWSPQVIHTSNPLYRQQLHSEGLRALPLRIPGSLNIDAVSHEEARTNLAYRLGLSGDPADQVLIAGVFGSVHQEWADTNCLRRLHQAALDKRRKLLLVHMGRAGVAGGALWQQLRTTLAGTIEMHALGELAPDELSRVLRGLDLGVATTPWAVAGKSSTISALLEHGVPVLVTRNDYQLRGQRTPEPDSHPLLLRFTGSLPELIFRSDEELRRPNSGKPISAVLMTDLSGNNKHL
jgi:hypothetical protein